MTNLNKDIEQCWIYPVPLLGESIFIVVHNKEYAVISSWNAYDAIMCSRITDNITEWKEYVDSNLDKFNVYNINGGEIDLEKAYVIYESNPEYWTLDYFHKFRR